MHAKQNIEANIIEMDHPDTFKYLAYAWNDVEGILEEVYGNGDRITAAYLAFKYGIYSYASYRFGGYLMGISVKPDYDEYDREGIIGRYRVTKGGIKTYIDVVINPAYSDNHWA